MRLEDIAIAYLSSRGSLSNVVVGPPGATYAMEMLKNDERNLKDKNYIPPWTPGKQN